MFKQLPSFEMRYRLTRCCQMIVLSVFMLTGALISNAQTYCDQYGYTDLAGTCGTSVCGYDSYCCDTEWDNFCASEAAVDGNCVYCLNPCFDSDSDGFTNCGGDCDDTNPAVYPGAVEICENGIDENCDGSDEDCVEYCDNLDYSDLLGDCAVSVCNYDAFCCTNSWDAFCAAEAAVDVNCTYCLEPCVDADGDGFTNCAGDCDDANPNAYPGGTEICGNGIDEDCNGTDESCGSFCDEYGYTDLGGPCALSVCSYDPYCCNNYWDNLCASEAFNDANCSYCIGGCHDFDYDGQTDCAGDCDDNNYSINNYDYDGDGYSTCAGDCDDFNFALSPQDNDGDGFSLCDGDCDDYDPLVGPEIDDDFDGFSECQGDCDDTNFNINPYDNDGDGLSECNGDCDDNNYFFNSFDWDGDGITTCGGDCNDYDPFIGIGTDADADGWSDCEGDCDDNDPTRNPGLNEICGNGIDENCDGYDEACQPFCDVAGYNTDPTGPCATSVCSYDPFCCNYTWDNYCASEAFSDANCTYCLGGCTDFDYDGSTSCDGDCDDFNYLLNTNDYDGDGYTSCAGDCNDFDPFSIPTDNDGDGFSLCDGDCDDNDPLVGPETDDDFDGYSECQGDCDDTAWWISPADWDGDGYSSCTGDCNDYDYYTNPGTDNDGDGYNSCIDCNDYNALIYPADVDGDGYSLCDGDCDDNDPLVGPETDDDYDGYSECQGDCDDTAWWISPADWDGDGYSSCTGDCNDYDYYTNPGTDNDGDGANSCVDCNDYDPAVSFPVDNDGDGYTGCGGDCDDNDPTVFPGADNDFDGWGACGYGDCDDNDPNINPGIAEICGNGIDENCDGADVGCNQTCSSAEYLTVPSSFVGSTSGSTPDGFSNCGAEGYNGQLWYKYQPSSDGTLTLDFCGFGTNYDTRLQIYTGCCGTLSCYADNDDSFCGLRSYLSVPVFAGTDYHIRIGGFSGGSGQFDVIISGPSGVALTGCDPPPINDDKVNAMWIPLTQNAISNVYPNCSLISGTCLGATVSPESQSPALTGEDVWYAFEAYTSGAGIKLNTTEFDGEVELQNSSGAMMEFENATAFGDEIFNYGNLVPGDTYFLAVRNYYSVAGNGDFTLCMQHLADSECDDPSGTYDLCSNFKADWSGANSYNFNFTPTGATPGMPTSGSTPAQIPLSTPSLALQHGGTYDVTVDALFQLMDAAGNQENVTVVGLQVCNIAIAPHSDVQVKVQQRCPAVLLKGSIIQGKPFTCAALNFTVEATEVTDCAGLTPIGFPFTGTTVGSSATIKLSNINIGGTIQGGGRYYSVRWQPNFSYGPGTWCTPQVIYVGGSVLGEMPSEPLADESRTLQMAQASLYPNPNSGDMVNLNISAVKSDNVFVSITDMNGRIVYTNRFAVDGSLNTIVTFAEPLASGLYNVQFIMDGETITEKMMIQK